MNSEENRKHIDIDRKLFAILGISWWKYLHVWRAANCHIFIGFLDASTINGTLLQFGMESRFLTQNSNSLPRYNLWQKKEKNGKKCPFVHWATNWFEKVHLISFAVVSLTCFHLQRLIDVKLTPFRLLILPLALWTFSSFKIPLDRTQQIQVHFEQIMNTSHLWCKRSLFSA